MTRRRKLDLALAALWLALCIVAAVLDWHVASVAFFAWAGGERWQSFWCRR